MHLKWTSGGLRAPTSRASGLGAAKDGVHHWKMQRLTAIGNLFLGLWLIWSIMHVAGMDYAQATAWLAKPVNAILMILFVISSFLHAVLGLQVVTEDYVHCEALKFAKLIAQKLVYFGLGVACIFSILKVAL